MKRILLSCFLFACLVISACTGDDGLVGPAGAEGVEGTVGVIGEDGPEGPEGADGVATTNVVTITLDSQDFSAPSSLYETATYTVSEITGDIVSDGVVLAYISGVDTTTSWYALPFIMPEADGVVLNYGYLTSAISIGINRNSGPPMAENFSGNLIKVVILEDVGKKGLGVDLSDHDAVMRAIGY